MKNKIALIGLGYVGMPLAVEFGKNFETIGFDISKTRVEELRLGRDRTLEVESHELKKATMLSYTNNSDDLRECNIYIVTVPTPVDKYKRPDLTSLIKSSETIGELLNKNDIVYICNEMKYILSKLSC